MGNKLSYPSVDLSSKVAVVTGGNTGIGYETAKALAGMGAHTFIACRSQERAAAAVDRMKQEVGEGKELKVEYLLVDLASFASVKDFVKTFKEKNLPLHILINNAAVCGTAFSKTDDGFDLQFQVNHLSPVLLTLELLPCVLETAAGTGDGRIVFVSSAAHLLVKWEPDNFSPVSEEGYGRFKMYGWTKLYNVMSTFALQRRLTRDTAVTLSTLHPGYIRTDLKRGFEDRKFLSFLNNVAQAAFSKNRQQGAATTINCAVNPELNSRQAFYYDDCRLKESSNDSRNEAYQEDMWAKTISFLKDHLSPDVVEKYGPLREAAAATEVIGEEVGAIAEGAGAASAGEMVETGEIAETVESRETIETGEIVKGEETVETGEIAETVEMGDTVETGAIAETTETGETTETAERGVKQLEEEKEKANEAISTDS